MHKQYSVVNDLGRILEDWRGFNFAHCQDSFLEAREIPGKIQDRIQVYWDMTLCRWFSRSRRFGGL